MSALEIEVIKAHKRAVYVVGLSIEGRASSRAPMMRRNVIAQQTTQVEFTTGNTSNRCARTRLSRLPGEQMPVPDGFDAVLAHNQLFRPYSLLTRLSDKNTPGKALLAAAVRACFL